MSCRETEDGPDGSQIVTCWCGVSGPEKDLFDDALYKEHCGGSGVLYCYCGGDLCSCHNHGEVECPGCPDCRDRADPDYNDYDEG